MLRSLLPYKHDFSAMERRDATERNVEQREGLHFMLVLVIKLSNEHPVNDCKKQTNHNCPIGFGLGQGGKMS